MKSANWQRSLVPGDSSAAIREPEVTLVHSALQMGRTEDAEFRALLTDRYLMTCGKTSLHGSIQQTASGVRAEKLTYFRQAYKPTAHASMYVDRLLASDFCGTMQYILTSILLTATIACGITLQPKRQTQSSPVGIKVVQNDAILGVSAMISLCGGWLMQ